MAEPETAPAGGVNPPVLTVICGLPGTGKSTLARALAARSGAAWLRVDTVEAALGGVDGPEGYHVIAAQARDFLATGLPVVIDAVHGAGFGLDWPGLAAGSGAGIDTVELICSDRAEHRARIEARHAADPGTPDWPAVAGREYRAPSPPARRIDTAGRVPADVLARVLAGAEGRSAPGTAGPDGAPGGAPGGQGAAAGPGAAAGSAIGDGSASTGPAGRVAR
ncbi:AAA family ATPase [Wenxinia saemankumensis]|uniref:AAA domain-containing protein n=1 Tax=Wenxinia saemankumensis TaxID=1447782 RepID=A0A1M6C217_9RHOB|nr:AAA family ATPase [Wenxinia saemankumensis]SHI54794.1 AAA domain-containing protein [Wenxinia saemankumensis]